MLGLFGTLNLGTRSLQTQRTGVEVAGQNLANVNNPAYARQRVNLQTSVALNTPLGPEGTGAEAASIQQIRDTLLDSHIQNELSVGGYWNAQQRALQYGQADMGEYIDQQAASLSGTTAAGDGTVSGIADELTGLFKSFQDLSKAADSPEARSLLIHQAQTLATRFNQTATNLDETRATLNKSLENNVSDANSVLSDIAKLNDQINKTEFSTGGVANDLRDTRQQKLETLANLVNFDQSTDANGNLNLSISGTTLVSGSQVLDTLQTYDAGGGQEFVRCVTGGNTLALGGGEMQGTIDARDGTLASIRTNLDKVAGELILQVDAIHATGYSLTGSTGANFFVGSGASNISVNSALANDPSLIQAAGVAGAPGDNTVIRALAQLKDTKIGGLNNQTLQDSYNQSVALVGQSLNNADNQISGHDALQGMLTKQRDSVSGVSVDEEMSDLIRFQKAYEASAKLVNTVDEMLDTVLSLKR